MADGTAIEWTDATWNPVTGCSVVSPGCTNCYAMRLAGTRLKHHPTRAGLTIDTKAGPVWNGQVRLNREALHQPLGWKRPRMIFVCAHGDLFHEAVPDEWIDQVFAVMALCPQHTFQVLTKRSARMRAYIARLAERWENLDGEGFGQLAADLTRSPCAAGAIEEVSFPLPNVWLGVSAEDQRRYDDRRRHLDGTPAALKFWSIEPMLGPINMHIQFVKPDWVIVGGESGPGARPMHPDWARSIRDQCAAADVPFFFKQWGAFRALTKAEHGQACGATLVHGADPHDPDSYMLPAPKKAAGRLLDGVEHSAFPAPREVPFR
jgi:protein gp37